MTRKALPQDYILDSGVLLDDFESDEYSITSGEKSVNTTEFKTGTKSLKVIGNAGVECKLDKNVSIDDIGDHIGFWFYCHTDPIETVQYISIKFAGSASWTDLISFTLTTYNIALGWNYVTAHTSDFVKTGQLLGGKITKLRISVKSLAEKQAIVSFDSLYIKVKRKPKVLITFDGIYQSIYEHAFPYMEARGIKGVAYVTPESLNVGNYCTTEQITDLHEAGWAIANHSQTHPNFKNLTQAEIEAELIQCKEWLDNHGFTRASRHVAYPYGQANDAVVAAMANTGMLTGRATANRYTITPVVDFNRIYCYAFENQFTLSNIKSILDTAIKRGITLVILVHNLQEEAGDTVTSIADFKALIDYIVGRKVDVVTIDEWYEGLTNPRYRYLPLSKQVV